MITQIKHFAPSKTTKYLYQTNVTQIRRKGSSLRRKQASGMFHFTDSVI